MTNTRIERMTYVTLLDTQWGGSTFLHASWSSKLLECKSRAHSSTRDYADQALFRLICCTGAKVNASAYVREGESLGTRLLFYLHTF